MGKMDDRVVNCDGLLLAPEGFVDAQYASLIGREDVRILQIRYLSDGPVICDAPSYRMHAP